MQRHRRENRPLPNLSNNSIGRSLHIAAGAGRVGGSAFLPGGGDGHGGYSSSAPLSTLRTLSPRDRRASDQPTLLAHAPISCWPHHVQGFRMQHDRQDPNLGPRLFSSPRESLPSSFGCVNAGVVGPGRIGVFAAQPHSSQAPYVSIEQSAATYGQTSNSRNHQAPVISTNALHPPVAAEVQHPVNSAKQRTSFTAWVPAGARDPGMILKRKDNDDDKKRKEGLNQVNGACLNCKRTQKQCNGAETCHRCMKKNVECIRTCNFCSEKKQVCDGGASCNHCRAEGIQCVRPIGTPVVEPVVDPNAIMQFLDSTGRTQCTNHREIRPWYEMKENMQRDDPPAPLGDHETVSLQHTAPHHNVMADVPGMMVMSTDTQTQAELVPRSVNPTGSQSSGWPYDDGTPYSPQSSILAARALRLVSATPVASSASQKTYSETTDLTQASDVYLPSVADQDEFTRQPWQQSPNSSQPWQMLEQIGGRWRE